MYGEGLGGWSCCQVDSSSSAISQIHEFERETVAKERGGGHEVDGCTDGAGAADHGLRGGWTDAGGFCGVIKSEGRRYGKHGGCQRIFVRVKMEKASARREEKERAQSPRKRI